MTEETKCGIYCIHRGILFILKKGNDHNTTTWITSEDILLSEISLSQKDK
jgi:hypothetical protein